MTSIPSAFLSSAEGCDYMGFFDWLFGDKKKDSGIEPKKTVEQDGKAIIKSEIWTEEGEEYTWTEYDDGSFMMEAGPGELWKTYFRLSTEIEKNKDIYRKIEACEASYEILPEISRLFKKDGGLPPRIMCRDSGPWLYMRLGQWNAARAAIQKCIDAKAYEDKQDEDDALKDLEEYRISAEIACSFISRNPGFLQSKLYKTLADTNANSDYLKEFTRASMLIRKEKQGRTYKLFINESVLQESDVMLSLSSHFHGGELHGL